MIHEIVDLNVNFTIKNINKLNRRQGLHAKLLAEGLSSPIFGLNWARGDIGKEPAFKN